MTTLTNNFKKQESTLALFLLALLSFFTLLIVNLLWSKLNFSFSYGGMSSDNFNSIIDLFIKLKKGIGLKELKHILWAAYGHSSYPSLYFIYQNIIALLIGRLNHTVIVFSNTMLTLITCIVSYKIATKIKNRAAGYTSVLILTLLPGIYGISRYCMVENMILPIIALSLYFLMKSKNLTSTRYSILLGLTLSAGFLIKYHFLIFCTGAILYEFFLTLYNMDKSTPGVNKKKIFNILIIAILAILPALPYYIHYYPEILRFFKMSYNPNVCLGHEMILSGSLNSWLFYPLVLINFQLSFPLFMIFLFSSFYLILEHKKDKGHLYLLLWLLVPYLFLQSADVKWSRYSIGYLPACAIACGLAISILKAKKRIIFLIIILILGIIQNLCFSFFNINKKALLKTGLLKDMTYFETDGNIYPFINSYEIAKPDSENRTTFNTMKNKIDVLLNNKETKLYFITKNNKTSFMDSTLISYLKLYSFHKKVVFNRIFIAADKDIEYLQFIENKNTQVISIFKNTPEDNEQLRKLMYLYPNKTFTYIEKDLDSKKRVLEYTIICQE